MFIFFPRLSSFLKPMTFFFATKLKSIFILIIASIMLIIPVFAYVISFTSTYKCGFASYSKNFLSFRSTICSFAIIVLLFDIEVLYVYPLVTSILGLDYSLDFVILISSFPYTSLRAKNKNSVIISLLQAPGISSLVHSVISILLLLYVHFNKCILQFSILLIFIRNSIQKKVDNYFFYSRIYIRSVAAPAFFHFKNFLYYLFKNFKPFLENKLEITINCMLVSSIIVMLVCSLNPLVLENCSIAVSLLSRKTLLCYTIRYSHVLVRGVKGLTPKKGPSPKVPPSNSDQGKTNEAAPANKTGTDIDNKKLPLFEITKTMNYEASTPASHDTSSEKTKTFHQPKSSEIHNKIQNQDVANSAIDNIKQSCWEYGKNKDKELSALQEQTKQKLLTFTTSNQKVKTAKYENASIPSQEDQTQSDSSLQVKKPTLISLYENTKSAEHTSTSTTKTDVFQYPKNDQVCLDRMFIPSSRYPDEIETQKKNNTCQYNIPSFSKSSENENLTFPQTLYEAFLRGIIKPEDKAHKVSIFLDENNNEVVIPAQKIPVKLTPHGQFCIKKTSNDGQEFPHDVQEGNLQVRLAIIDYSQTKKAPDALYDSNQTHIAVTADNGNTYYILGILTSSSKGDYLTNIQFKEFQEQKQGKPPINNGESKTPKPQNIIPKDNLEKIDSNKVTILKDDKEYLVMGADIMDKIKEEIIHKPAKMFDFSGITIEKLKKAITFHDIQVVNKKTGSPKFKKANLEGEDSHKKSPKTQTKFLDIDKNPKNDE